MKNSLIIFGLDVMAYKERGKKTSRIFSLVIITENHLEKHSKISKRQLIQKIRDIKPDYVAIDNIFELTSNAQGVVRFLESIPPATVLVQVTGNPRTGMEKVTNLIRKHNLRKDLTFTSTQKLTALETAEVVAKLCVRRIGHVIVAFEEEIKINVTKKKSHGKGGWSAPRYERISRSAVQQAATEVEFILRENGVEWDVFKYPQKRVFLVRLEREMISFIQSRIKPLTTDLVKVTLNRVTKSTLDFQPLDISMAPSIGSLKNVILGLDPGTTTGIAILDCNRGTVLYLGSKRECGVSEIIRISTKYGKVSCVAADVIPAPAMVDRVARITGAKLLTPSVLTSAAQKREYLQNYEDLTVNYGHLNSHERDALFGALKGFNHIRPQFEKIQRSIEESYTDLLPQSSEIQRLVLAGNSIANAIFLIRGKEDVRSEEINETDYQHLITSLKHENIQWQAKFETISEELDKLDLEAKYWRDMSRDQINQLKKMNKQIQNVKIQNSNQSRKKISEAVGREVGRIKEENNSLRRLNKIYALELAKLKEIKNFWVQGHEFPLKPVKSFSDASIRETNRNYGLHDGDIVLVLDPSGGGAQTALKLIDFGIRGVIVPEGSPKFSDQALNQFENNCIPFLQLSLKAYADRNLQGDDLPLEIWVYDELYLTDISVKEEIRKQELQLRENLRKRRMSLLIEQKVAMRNLQPDSINLEKILNDFKDLYIALHKSHEVYSPYDDPEEEE
jgi:predicted RNase H-like nuclease (RuvC/YqgF family)